MKATDRERRTLPPGTVLDGKYRIIEPIGEGGMGVVYHAEHLLMLKEVALKRLHPHLTAFGQIVQRFEREAQAAARIDHPNVCLVTDCGRDAEGGFFIVM
jgi:serine/threonine-protein kinase